MSELRKFLVRNPVSDVIIVTNKTNKKIVKWMYNMYNEIHCELLHRDSPSLSSVCKKFEQYRVNSCTTIVDNKSSKTHKKSITISPTVATCRINSSSTTKGGANQILTPHSSPYTIKNGCKRHPS